MVVEKEGFGAFKNNNINRCYCIVILVKKTSLNIAEYAGCL